MGDRLVLVMVALSIATSGAAAQSVFDGTWMIDTATDEHGGKPVARLLKDGMFECPSCVVHYRVPADGRFHPIRGMDFDAVAARPLDRRTVELRFAKAGKHAMTLVERVSADGATLQYRQTDLSQPDGRPQVAEGRMARVGAVPEDAHAASGEWRPLAGATSSEAPSLTIETRGDRVTMVQPGGRRFTATIGGSAAPVRGDSADREVRVERPGPRSLALTIVAGGETVSTGLITVAADGRTLRYEGRDLKLGQTLAFDARKR